MGGADAFSMQLRWAAVVALLVGVFGAALGAAPFEHPALAQTLDQQSLAAESVQFQGYVSSDDLPVNPLPGQTVVGLSTTVVATSDSDRFAIDAFIDGSLIDSVTVDLRRDLDLGSVEGRNDRAGAVPQVTGIKSVPIRLNLGAVDHPSTVQLWVRHLDEDLCQEFSHRVVEMTDVHFHSEGDVVLPKVALEFFPSVLDSVSVVVELSDLSEATGNEAVDVVALLASHYRQEGFAVDLVDEVPATQNPLHRNIVFGDTQPPVDANVEPKWLLENPQTLVVRPGAAVADIAELLDTAEHRIDRDQMLYQVDDIGKTAVGATEAAVNVAVPQPVFGAVPDQYRIALAGWNTFPANPDQGSQTLTVSSGGNILHTQTLTGAEDWSAQFTIVEPDRDASLDVTLRGPDLGNRCQFEPAPIELGVDYLEVLASGNRDIIGFGSLPQRLGSGYRIKADADELGYAAKLVALMHRTTPEPIWTGTTGPTVAINVEADGADPAVLSASEDGLVLDGSPRSAEALLDAVAEESWYALRGDTATIGRLGLATSDLSGRSDTYPNLIEQPQADMQLAFTAEDEPEAVSEEDSAGLSESAASPVEGAGERDGIPTSVAIGALFAVIITGVLFTQRGVLLGRRQGGQ